MTGIIFVTQLIDEDDPVLGFTPSLVRALSKRAEVRVVANEVRHVPADLGAEVVSLGKERGRARWRRGIRYEACLAALCRQLRPAVLVAHMCPPYITHAAPIMKLTSTRSILWYVHPADTPALRRAERLADAVVTCLPSSYPRATPKLRVIGHSIDTDRFSPEATPSRTGPLDLVAVGRWSPVKDYPRIIRAVALARQRGAELTLRIVGPAATQAERAHRRDGERLIDELDLRPIVTLEDGVVPALVPDLLARASALVNATTPGAADKVVFEAMACGRPVLVASTAFAPLLADLPIELGFTFGDHVGLADAIVRLSMSSQSVRSRTGALLRQRVVADHSLEHWADEIVTLANSLQAGRAALHPVARPRRGDASRGAVG